MTPRRTRVRPLTYVLLLAVLAGVQVVHAVWRLDALGAERRRELVQRVERELDELATSVRGLLEENRGHAAYLSRSPAVAELLDDPPPVLDRRRELESHVLAYLVSFRTSDRVRGFDRRGSERFRCERIGQGVGALPPSLLLETVRATSAESPAPGADPRVTLSPPVTDDERVELPPGERKVFEYGVAVARDGKTCGHLLLSVLASPTLARVRRFAPESGITACLVDANGRSLGADPSKSPHPREREKAESGRAELRSGPSEIPKSAIDELLRGATQSEAGDCIYLAEVVSEDPLWRIVGEVPVRVLDRPAARLGGEYLWIVSSLVLVTLILFAGTALVVRRRLAELRMSEAETRHSLERRLRQSERLGSLGLLTAGVAHEINNPLEGIGNYLALLERDAGDAERRKKWVGQIRYGFERIRTIVSDLSDFARTRSRGGTANVAQAVDQAHALVRHSSSFRDVEVTRHGIEEVGDVAVDPGRLEQVLINFLLNAARAMNGRGRIRISARSVSVPEKSARMVEITHEDDGPGIPDEALERIFDPFFSTTGGTGLGLSVSYGIIRAHGGTLAAENRPEGGARFILRLPEASSEAIAEDRGTNHAAL